MLTLNEIYALACAGCTVLSAAREFAPTFGLARRFKSFPATQAWVFGTLMSACLLWPGAIALFWIALVASIVVEAVFELRWRATLGRSDNDATAIGAEELS